MSGETEASVSGWTTDTLREYLIQRIDGQDRALSRRMDDADKAIQAALVSAEKAVTKAETASEKRFEGVNEFRQSLADQTAAFPTRTEVTAQLEVVRATADRNTEALKDIELRFTSRLDLASGRDTGQGETRTEQRLNMSQVIAGIATLVAVISLVLYAIKK